MTVSQNIVDALNRNRSRVQLPVLTTDTVNEGDLLYWDATNVAARPLTAASQLTGSNFLGTAESANTLGLYPNDPALFGVLVLCRAVVWLNTTVGDTYGWFTPVTVGADSQTITAAGVNAAKTLGVTIPIGPAQYGDTQAVPRPLQATPVPETVAGSATTRIRVALIPNHVYTAAV